MYNSRHILFVLITLFITAGFSLDKPTLFPDGPLKHFNAFCDDELFPLVGKSHVDTLIVSDSLTMVHSLAPGYTWPLCGLSLLTDSTTAATPTIDWSAYDTLEVTLSSKYSKMLRFTILSNVNNPLHKQAHYVRHQEQDHITQTTATSIKLVLSNFVTPLWWYQRHGEPIQMDSGFLKNVIGFEITNGNSKPFGKKDTLKVFSMRLIKKEQSYAFVWIALTVILALLLTVYFIHASKQKLLTQLKNMKDNEVQYSGPFENVELNKLTEYLATRFEHPDLNLEMVETDIGMHHKKIASLIKENFNLNFRSYLNYLRINKAKELLATTTLTISEISYDVGFNNITHFNRVFKQMNEMTGSQWREQKRNVTELQ